MNRISFDLRRKSLARGNMLVATGVLLSLPLSHFPQVKPAPGLLGMALLVTLGAIETFRSLRSRWSFYHAGVIFCIYMDLMALFLVLFLLITPYLSLGVTAR